MKILKTIVTSTLTAILFAAPVMADKYGVGLTWNTKDAQAVLDMMPAQKTEFGKLIDSGDVSDMYLLDSEIEGTPVKLLRFVIEGDSEEDVRDKLSDLPLYKSNLVTIQDVQYLGIKWLDKIPTLNNYALTLTWKDGIDSAEVDRVLGLDLQKIVNLNRAGLITSSYLNTKKVEEGKVHPIYLLAVLAEDEEHAQDISKQFEAVKKGYADVSILELGEKFDMANRK